MLLANYLAIAVAIRRAVTNEAPWFWRVPGRDDWALLVIPSANTGILSLPRILAYLTVQRSPALQPGQVVDYQKLVSVLAYELPIFGDPGQRLKAITVREGMQERIYPNTCELRLSDLPWAQSPQVEDNRSLGEIDAAFFVPVPGNRQTTSRHVPGWCGPDLGAPSPSSAEHFYRILEPLDLKSRSPTVWSALIVGYLLSQRDAERFRCQVMGLAVPTWLGSDHQIEQDAALVQTWWGLVYPGSA